MSRRRLGASLRLWRKRLRFREGRLMAWQQRRDRAKIEKWRLLVSRAERMVARRKMQIEQTEPLRLRALREARRLLGRHVMETGGNNRGAWVERIISYAGGHGPEPWCVSGVIWCYGHAGSKVVRPGFTRAVRFMLQPGLKLTSWPKAGMIVRFKFDHTGMFICWCNAQGRKTSKRGATHIRSWEANTGASGAVSDGDGGDGIYEKVRARSLVQDFLRVTR